MTRKRPRQQRALEPEIPSRLSGQSSRSGESLFAVDQHLTRVKGIDYLPNRPVGAYRRERSATVVEICGFC